MVIVPGSGLSGEPAHPAAFDEAALTVLIVDPYSLYLEAFGRLLEGPPFEASVLRTRDSETALALLELHRPAVVFADVRSRPVTWQELTVSAQAVGCRVVLMADPDDAHMLLDALSAPVAGLFTKDSSVEDFATGVTAVLSGHRSICRSLMDTVLTRLDRPSGNGHDPAASVLSTTELEILKMLGQARSVAEIAHARSITAKTARNHIASIYRKLHFRSRAEAMLWAVRTGLAN